MDLQDLRSFQALAEELSFTAAARRLHVSQPSLSKRLQRLERHLGVTRLERSTSAVALTAAGEWLLGRSASLLNEWRAVTDQASRLAASGPVSPADARLPLRLTVPNLGSGRLQAYLSAAMPGYEVAVSAVPVPEALERLGRGDGVDAVLGYSAPDASALPTAPGAHVTTLLLEPLWIMLSARHALAERDELTVDDVVAHGLPWIVGPDDDPVGQWEGPFLLGRAPGAQLRTMTQSSQVEVARGRAVSLATPLLPPNELLALRPLVPAVTIHVYLSWQPHRLPAAGAAELLAAVRGFHRHRAQHNPRYWRWLCDRPGHYPGIAPDPVPSVATGAPVVAQEVGPGASRTRP